MQGFPLLHALLVPNLLQLAETASAAVATVPQIVQPQQNLTVNGHLGLLDAPSNQVQVEWRVDSTHTLTFTKYTSASPERDYFAALISTQTSIFAAYLSSPSPHVQEDEIEYNFYGVNVQIGNYGLTLTYPLVSSTLGAVGAFLQKWKMCETTWRLMEKEETDVRGRVISVGLIQRERNGVTNATVMKTALG